MLSKILIILQLNFIVLLQNALFFEVKETIIPTKDFQQIEANLKIIKQNISSKSDSILDLCKKTLYLSQERNYDERVGTCYFYLGLIYKEKNINDSALIYFEKGLNNTSNKLATTADLYWEIADINRITGNYSAALEKSLILKELIENKNIEINTYPIYNLLGLCYQGLLEYELALENYKKSVSLAEKNKNWALAGVIYSNIGKLYYDQNNYDTALTYFEKGVRLEEEYKLFSSAGFSYNSIANIYLEFNNLDSVEHYLLKSHRYFIDYDSLNGLTEYYLTSGKYYISKGNFVEAKKTLSKAIEIATKTGRKIVLHKAYKLMADICSNNNNFEEAYLYFSKFFEVHNSMYDVIKISKAKAIEQRLKHQEKESEIVTLALEKQKTISILLLIIVCMAILIGSAAILYLLHFKKLNKELKLSKEKAEESDKLKSQFLRTISHEIRTPLNGITGFSEMILNENLTKEELSEINRFISKNSDDLISTIENMVDMAHLTTGQYPINRTTFNVSTLFKNVIKKVKEESIHHSKKNIRIILANNNILEIESDKTILTKIIKELIKNALLYTDKGSITIGYNQENSYVKIFVKDTGMGIPQEEMEIIFSPFRQTQEVFDNRSAGSGLGLAIVNEFIKILDGKIWFGSEPNKGSIFFISFPIK